MKDVCEITCFDEDKVKRVKNILSKKNMIEISELLKILSDETRLIIAYSLILEKELCVCDISIIVKATVATTSHHLKKLSNAGVVKNRKEGKMVYYSLYNYSVKAIVTYLLSENPGSIHNLNVL